MTDGATNMKMGFWLSFMAVSIAPVSLKDIVGFGSISHPWVAGGPSSMPTLLNKTIFPFQVSRSVQFLIETVAIGFIISK